MKRILITGSNSYIGKEFKRWIETFYSNEYEVKTISLRDKDWEKVDFSQFSVIYHTVGIAHRKQKKNDLNMYYKINRDLPYQVAFKAKNEGVKQFVFLSSMSVYGIDEGHISQESVPNPTSFYGKSKLEADQLLGRLDSEDFSVAIVRPPMVYGKGCTGNYAKLSKLAKVSPIFPLIENKRSMISIENLSSFIKLIIDNECKGIFHPQNNEYVCTSEMVRMIAEQQGKNLKLTRMFNPLIKMLNISIVKKLFGELVYAKQLSHQEGYQPISLEASIKLAEK
ncbi:NAD-dependent epimerase/dehydratase family protein [Rossellomorea marisflavi]|uniref:NAD-dependent epimerase/dehydratase family protein n=1 Tax=Rossellomorea marisflavi TaxID=189381 RepID=UPI003AE46934